MRELKLRYKWKRDWFYIDLRNDNTRAKFEAFESINKTTPLEQFTGLKDKNGVEIWEGDIVEAIMNYHGKETDVKFTAKIIYNENIGSFQISYLNMDDHFVNDTISHRYFLKKIGNIWDNPELLK